MARCLIALGSNLNDRAAALDAAVDALRREPGVAVVAHSRWHETAPVGGPADQPPFLNGAATLDTDLSPWKLLELLHAIEAQAGRVRAEHWGPRQLDLDLLLYDERVIDSRDLVLPHPRMSFRRFVLEPACEIAADMRHPLCGITLAELLATLDRYPRWMALQCGDDTVANELAGRIDGVVHRDSPLDWRDNPDELFTSLARSIEKAAPRWVIWSHSAMWAISPFIKDAETIAPKPALVAVVELPSLDGALNRGFIDMYRGLAPLIRLRPGPIPALVAELEAAIAAIG